MLQAWNSTSCLWFLSKAYFVPFLIVVSMLTLLGISSQSFIIIWTMMELSLFLVVSMVSLGGGSSSTISAWKYYVIQFFGSAIVFLSEMVLVEPNFLKNLMFITGLMLKIGVFPFTYWLVQVSENLEWWKVFVLNSFSKIIPLFLFLGETGELVFAALCVSWLVVIWVHKSSSLRYLITLSSAFQMSWLFGCMMVSLNLTVIYFVIYSIYLLFVLSLFSGSFSWSISSLYLGNGSMKLYKLFVVLSMIGLPPFSMFMLKVDVVCLLLNEFEITSISLVLGSMLFISAYLHILFPMLLAGNSSKVNKMSSFLPSLSLCSLLLLSLLAPLFSVLL